MDLTSQPPKNLWSPNTFYRKDGEARSAEKFKKLNFSALFSAFCPLKAINLLFHAILYLYIVWKINNEHMRIAFVLLTLTLLSCVLDKKGKKEKIDKGNEVSADGSKVVRSKYEDGKTRTEVTYKNGKQNGIARSFDKNGNLLLELSYADNKREGLAKKYYEGGKRLFQTTEYKNDKMHGRQIKYRENGNVMSEARYENDFPCLGLKEYLLDNTPKKMYPQINIRPINRLESGGVYILQFSMSDKVRSVKYYSGKLNSKGCIYDDLYFILQDQHKKTGELKYNLPPGGFVMEELNIIAVVETLLGNSYITQRSYNLAIDN